MSNNNTLLQVGMNVRIHGLKSEKGKLINNSLGRVSADFQGERYPVRLRSNGKIMSIKPENLRTVCNYCDKDKKDLMQCGGCLVASYCDPKCQRADWKNHKSGCKQWKCKKVTAAKCSDNEKSLMMHPSWGHLTSHQLSKLREWHNANRCKVPWPLTGLEIPEMLDFPLYGFLLNHPNQRFEAGVQKIPEGFVKKFRTQNKSLDEALPVLFENVKESEILNPNNDTDIDDGLNQYFRRVPRHFPPTMYAVIDEVLWTQFDNIEFEKIFDSNSTQGINFCWPGAEIIGLCPATGKKVPFSMNKKHLLVASIMIGLSRGVISLRIMPRVLTLEGYKKIVEYNGAMQFNLGGTSLQFKDVPLYPNALKAFPKPENDPFDNFPALTASVAYREFYESGRYSGFEEIIRMNVIEEKSNAFECIMDGVKTLK